MKSKSFFQRRHLLQQVFTKCYVCDDNLVTLTLLVSLSCVDGMTLTFIEENNNKRIIKNVIIIYKQSFATIFAVPFFAVYAAKLSNDVHSSFLNMIFVF